MTELLKLITDNFGQLGVMLVVATLIFHVVMTLRNKGRSDLVQTALYEQLRQELIDARGEIASLNTKVMSLLEEKTSLREQLGIMTIKIVNLEECEASMQLLKLRLQEKDDTIREQQIENSLLKDEISKLKDRIHHLELRLAQDEARFPKE